MGFDQIPPDESASDQHRFSDIPFDDRMWGLMALVTAVSHCIYWKKKRLERGKWRAVGVDPLRCVSSNRQPGGWMTAEIGRQPWVVYGLLLTAARGFRDD